ncbi:MAG: alanine--tRNA ligase [Candidatus Vogelbacteria bacterium CG10_big_fil_rev_8_21_14_0_10_45_14]|uniref:alanine--tRNA ligase n=1 Tax=Candidatus Vogelbacteria bacterium CG10_big_fil_rev_8_21_14_0_10_45_14 TaxID=1975042 RepID=A0A2H0RME1_9BACT|nr:MAG: alanine--tRNA ligase [Candidatus Vogelbacteria bacterium CG10_big_fil_rev_8_21_14_0_10_45_14]
MTSKEVRQGFLDYMKERGHLVIPSASIVPENDPTTLFTGSGMQPMIPYLLGEEHPLGARLCNSQRSFRAEDILEVGDNRHTTAFEMLGNWSLGGTESGGYGRRDQLTWFFRFLTDIAKIDPSRLYTTVFIGDSKIGVPKDEESILIWKSLFAEKGIAGKCLDIGSEADGYKKGMGDGRIFSYDVTKNWWSRAGVPNKMPDGEPGGPDSEVFYDFGTEHDVKFGLNCHPNCDCGRFMEIGNCVFMEYRKTAGEFVKLAKPNVDFGGGLERIVAASCNTPDVFDTDMFSEAISEMVSISQKPYAAEARKPMRIIADHLRATAQMAIDGIVPTNSEQGYTMRRLLRRAVRYSDMLSLSSGTLTRILPAVIAPYIGVYDKMASKQEEIARIITDEEEKFRATIAKGLRLFESLNGNRVDGKDAYTLFTTYGFPVEMTRELAEEKGMTIDMEGFESEMEAHRDTSRMGAGQKFKGGLADHGERSTQYHTLTHMLHEALRRVLGNHVDQKGSNITGERLRFDFTHNQKMTEGEKQQVEDTINEELGKHHKMTFQIMSVPEAKAYGAIGLFEDKYGEKIKVYTMGDENTGIFSKEICGGPHVENTDDIVKDGKFRIKKEEAVAQGIRRIKAVLN